MAELVADYFAAGWRERTLSCPCGWQGDSRAMAMELHDAVTDYACRQCGNLLLIVSHPTMEQVRAAAGAGHDEAQAHLAILEEALVRFPPATD